MRTFKKIGVVFLISVLLFLFTNTGYAENNTIQGKYFTVYYDGCSLTEIARKLNAKYFLHIDVLSENTSGDINSIIGELFDSIYLQVCDILDIHIYSFKGTVNILPSKPKIREILKEYMSDPPDMSSFYFHEKSTIYISLPEMTLGMLSHEIAHAIISNYFVVTPPAKVQEVLAGYVEYSIRKATGTLAEIRQ